LTRAWLRNPIRLTLLYGLCLVGLGLPLVWTFDADDEGGVLAGLVLGAFAILIPTFVCLVLPRRWGMTLFFLESLSPWVVMISQPVPTRILAGFILWSLLELPMYGFELLGLVDRGDASLAPRPRPQVPTLLLAWLAALGVAYTICYAYISATPMTQYPRLVWGIAFLFVPLPPLIAARQLIRRVLQQQVPSSRTRSAAG
jgi:hypothetical protein